MGEVQKVGGGMGRKGTEIDVGWHIKESHYDNHENKIC